MGVKLELDKYYTPLDLAAYCYNKTIEIIGKENISEIIEPSAGKGVFLDVDSSIIGYDIKPEDDRIIQADFLELDLGYKAGRLFLGNPPYGRCLNLAQKFYKKCICCGDYISFILPISQYNTNLSFYEFDLIYSEDLGEREYSGIKLHCVLNIYKRPILGFNPKPKKKLEDIEIIRQDKSRYSKSNYDVRMCYWGNGATGKILKEGEHYSGEYKIIIHNEEHKEEIKEFIETFDWKNYVNSIAMKKLEQHHILEVLRKNLEYLK